MVIRILTLLVCLTLVAVPIIGHADAVEKARSCWLSGLIHEDNSIVASVLYLPYMIFLGPVWITEAIIWPKPASQGSIPPPAHRVSH
jgi:hypothetical protein